MTKAPLVSPNIGCWIETNRLLPGAFKVDGTSIGNDVYIIRVRLNGGLYPGKHVNNIGSFATWAGEEHRVKYIEMLCYSQMKWVNCYGNIIPSNCFIGGHDEDGEDLYVGKCYHDGNVVVGGVKKGEGVLKYGWFGSEYVSKRYDILVVGDDVLQVDSS